MTEILPDEKDVRKPRKVDADEEGRGGDDGSDACRYGIATRVARAQAPAGGERGQGVSLGYDYKRQRPRERASAEDAMEKLFSQDGDGDRALATRYRIPR